VTTREFAVAAAIQGDLLQWGDVIIIGGGCYGTFYVKQLERAAEQGRVSYRRLLVVDRNAACQTARELPPRPEREIVVREWGAFLDDYLATASTASGGAFSPPAGPPARSPAHIVPTPLMPHLMYQWLLRRAAARWPGRLVESRPVTSGPGTPYDMAGPDGTRYVSFADWLCPTHCIEPAICPVIRGPRTWDMAEALERLAEWGGGSIVRQPVLFRCEHQVFGVGTFRVDEVLAGDASVAGAGASGQPVGLLVGTISHCHGAVSLLHLGRV
jgi:hypothetical protein